MCNVMFMCPQGPSNESQEYGCRWPEDAIHCARDVVIQFYSQDGRSSSDLDVLMAMILTCWVDLFVRHLTPAQMKTLSVVAGHCHRPSTCHADYSWSRHACIYHVFVNYVLFLCIVFSQISPPTQFAIMINVTVRFCPACPFAGYSIVRSDSWSESCCFVSLQLSMTNPCTLYHYHAAMTCNVVCWQISSNSINVHWLR